MIVRSIAVANWRCFLEPVVIGEFTDGLNIVHAPNGTGKSKLFEALRHAMLDGHETERAILMAEQIAKHAREHPDQPIPDDIKG